jgi:hypothetical protein
MHRTVIYGTVVLFSCLLTYASSMYQTPTCGTLTMAREGGITINNYGPIMNPIFLSHSGPLNINIAANGTTVQSESISPSSFTTDSRLSALRLKWMGNCKECWKVFMEHVRTHMAAAPSLYAYIKGNRWSLALKSIIGSYLFINYMLFRMVNFLSAPQRWMYWRNDIFLVQLMRMSSADLIQELLETLRLRASLPPDQTPFQMLFAELDDEICQLQQYSRWVDYITKLSTMQNHCAASVELLLPSFFGVPIGHITGLMINTMSLKNIFYVQHDLVQKTQEYLRRLMYLRRILEEELAVDLPQVVADPIAS